MGHETSRGHGWLRATAHRPLPLQKQAHQINSTQADDRPPRPLTRSTTFSTGTTGENNPKDTVGHTYRQSSRQSAKQQNVLPGLAFFDLWPGWFDLGRNFWHGRVQCIFLVRFARGSLMFGAHEGQGWSGGTRPCLWRTGVFQ